MATPENVRKTLKGNDAYPRTPLWRRITALFGLAFFSVAGGAALAATVGLLALIGLLVIERALG